MCFSATLSATTSPFLTSVIISAQRLSRLLLCAGFLQVLFITASLLYRALFTPRSDRQWGSAAEVVCVWVCVYAGGMWNMSSTHRWITLEVLLSFWWLWGLWNRGMRWRNTLICGVCSVGQTCWPTLTGKTWNCIKWAKTSCGALKHTFKKNTAGEKNNLLKYWQHNPKIEDWSVSMIENCVFKSPLPAAYNKSCIFTLFLLNKESLSGFITMLIWQKRPYTALICIRFIKSLSKQFSWHVQ